jgi:hypothetical protein
MKMVVRPRIAVRPKDGSEDGEQVEESEGSVIE